MTFAGCTKVYKVAYQTSLADSDRLDFEDEYFAFKFVPLPNGIWFDIYNKTKTTAKIIWDKSYFIMPDGNSYKALNTDLLKEERRIAEKAKYLSLIHI